jgi:hypothetical protein
MRMGMLSDRQIRGNLKRERVISRSDRKGKYQGQKGVTLLWIEKMMEGV